MKLGMYSSNELVDADLDLFNYYSLGLLEKAGVNKPTQLQIDDVELFLKEACMHLSMEEFTTD